MRATALLCCLLVTLPSLAEAPASPVKVERVDYKGWPDSWKVSNGACELVVVPAVTRVMRFSLAGGKNVLWENPELAGKTFTAAEDGVWHNVGGEKLWPTQQKDLFKKYTGKDAWPPPYPWDAGASKAEAIPGGVRLTLPHDARFGAHAVREFTLDPSRPMVHVHQWIEKTEGSAAEMTVWTVCQVDDPTLAMLAADESPSGYRLLGAEARDVKRTGDAVVLRRDENKGLKIGVVPAVRNGWVASSFVDKGPDGGGVVFVQSHGLVANSSYPDAEAGVGCQAELYTAPRTFAPYTEMELLSPLVALKAGEKLESDLTWQLVPVPSGEARDVGRVARIGAAVHIAVEK